MTDAVEGAVELAVTAAAEPMAVIVDRWRRATGRHRRGSQASLRRGSRSIGAITQSSLAALISRTPGSGATWRERGGAGLELVVEFSDRAAQGAAAAHEVAGDRTGLSAAAGELRPSRSSQTARRAPPDLHLAVLVSSRRLRSSGSRRLADTRSRIDRRGRPSRHANSRYRHTRARSPGDFEDRELAGDGGDGRPQDRGRHACRKGVEQGRTWLPPAARRHPYARGRSLRSALKRRRKWPTVTRDQGEDRQWAQCCGTFRAAERPKACWSRLRDRVVVCATQWTRAVGTPAAF